MTRHRRFLLTLGILQLLAAVVLFLSWPGANTNGAGMRTWDTSRAIAQDLRDAGVNVPEVTSGGGSAAFEAIARPVRSAIHEAESGARPPFLAVGFFGVMALIAGGIPGRRRPLPPAEA